MLKRTESMKTIEKNRLLSERIRELKQEHPFWGYRRVWAYLRYREDFNINKKRIYRLMKKENLLAKEDTRLKAKRGKFPYKSKPKPIKPHQIWGIDMTKVLIQGVVALDWFTKKIISCSLSSTSKTSNWLNALDSSLNSQFPQGIKDV